VAGTTIAMISADIDVRLASDDNCEDKIQRVFAIILGGVKRCFRLLKLNVLIAKQLGKL